MKRYNARDALKRAKANTYGKWSQGELSARTRLEKSVTIPYLEPTFKLTKGSKIFAIGSCFARNVEESLSQSGIEVKSLELECPYKVNSARKTGIINKYNPAQIYHELAWAFEKETFYDDILIDVGGKFIDPCLKSGEEPQELSLARDFRGTLKKYFQSVAECEAAILTLGMVECWYDKEFEVVLNQPPHPKAVNSFPDRYQFVLLELDDILDYLRKSVEILQENGVRNVVITTSPVSLARTFTDKDVVVANCYSKSLLRVACEMVVDEFTGVDYFPSFESVMYNRTEISWQNDLAHASDYVVGRIIDQFIQRYVEGANTLLSSEESGRSLSDVELLRRQVDRYKNLLIKAGVSF
ncbi:GSCFA domain-containing protein [Microbulbifer zhoushanensis]|uniref:GSCFA domain-containing protein n=1 Tax=Microbulbifer zhoushanensis TaxID=2904254 RepID=UPI001F34ABFC|nr:GSCFA domain-containing protein [Microbulbifer zhoushanensis]